MMDVNTTALSLAGAVALAAVLKSDGHRALTRETSLAANEIQTGGREHLLVRAHHGADDALLVGAELRQVHARILGTDDAERLVRAGIAQTTSRVDQRLRGDAGDIDAGAADELALHHGDLPARLRALHREGLSGLAAADNQQVDVLDCVRGHVSPWVVKGYLSQRAVPGSIPSSGNVHQMVTAGVSIFTIIWLYDARLVGVKERRLT